MNRTIQSLLAGTALATLGLVPLAAHAQVDPQTQGRIDALERELQALKGQVQATQAAQQAAEKKAAEGGDFKVSTAGGLTIESKDGAFSGHVGGRILIDQAFYHEDKSRLGDGAEFRSLRLDVGGKMFFDFPYKIQVDFGSNAVSVKDTFFGYDGAKPFEFIVGNYLPPVGLGNMTSNKYTTFMEPALQIQNLQDRRIGVQATARGAEGWTATLGLFSSGVATDPGGEGDTGYEVAGRVTYAPIMSKTQVLHFGVGADVYYPNSEGLRYRDRPESHVTGSRLVDTGTLANVSHETIVEPEVAFVLGPVHGQAEYQWLRVTRNGGSQDLTFGGWYGQVGWFITGESRPYQLKDTPYSADFGRVKPAKNVGEGGLGAWEVAARYSTVNLSDNGVRGGGERDITLGLNWYLNPFTRVMFNYVKVNTDNDAPGTSATLLPGKTAGNDDPSVYEMRAQLDF